ncbi:(2Fe-2S)-binding protein [Celerinatantimonas sp. YJH-8]|uniref:(2Fe-2S)-binding protein n=1 Tax=Celerinatantimonas sp. YJH-8 TaxID=3228714 RepID=UPI0038CAA891
MFVCICQGITDEQIRKAVREGNISVKEIKQQLQIATQCGRCIKATQAIINQELEASANYYQVA